MKNLLLTFTLIVLGIGTLQAQDPSAIADFESTTQGLLVPRMDSLQRAAISSPATGLLVYQTDKQLGFWFYNGTAWVSLSDHDTQNKICDADSDTKVEVEQNPGEDVIRFTMDSTEYFKMDGYRLEVKNSNSSVAFGDSALLNGSGSNNVILGFKSGMLNETGSFNTLIGTHAGRSNKTGSFNTILGHSAGLLENTGENTLIGFRSGLKNSGRWNTMVGSRSGEGFIAGERNVFLGQASGFEKSMGSGSILIGYSAGRKNNGSFNTYIGYNSGRSAKFSTHNIAIGHASLYHNDTCSGLVAIGDSTLFNNTIGSSSPHEGKSNVALGYRAGRNNSLGSSNTFIGHDAAYANTSGRNNVVIGDSAHLNNQSGHENVIIGYKAGMNNKSADNVMIGNAAGINNTMGFDNVFIGESAGQNNSVNYLNTFVGQGAGAGTINGGSNTIIGGNAGRFTAVGDSNVIIGHAATNQFQEDHELVIANKLTSPLIYGRFDLDRVGINTVDDLSHHLMITGDTNTVRLVGPKTYGHGSTINFGDANFVYLNEIEDDVLKIYARSGIIIDGGTGGVDITNPTPDTGYVWVSPSEMKTSSSDLSYICAPGFATVTDLVTSNVEMYGAVDIPHGAKVLGVTLYYNDSEITDNLVVKLIKSSGNGLLPSDMATLSPTGTTGLFGGDISTTSITDPIIDASYLQYYVQVENTNSTWPAEAFLGWPLTFGGIKITYEK